MSGEWREGTHVIDSEDATSLAHSTLETPHAMANLPAVYVTDYDHDPNQKEPHWESYYIFTVGRVSGCGGAARVSLLRLTVDCTHWLALSKDLMPCNEELTESNAIL